MTDSVQTTEPLAIPVGVDTTVSEAMELMLGAGEDMELETGPELDRDLEEPTIAKPTAPGDEPEEPEPEEPAEEAQQAPQQQQQQQQAPQQQQQQQQPPSHEKIQTDMEELRSAGEELQAMVADGRIDQQQFNAAMQNADQLANNLMTQDLNRRQFDFQQQQQQQQQQYQNQQQYQQNLDLALKRFPELRSTEAQEQARSNTINYLTEQGYTQADIESLTPRVQLNMYQNFLDSKHRTEKAAMDKQKARNRTRRGRTPKAKPESAGLIGREEQLDAIAGLLGGL